MKVIVTGSRDWENKEAVYAALENAFFIAWSFHEPLTVIHGNARGADSIASKWCREAGDRPVFELKYPARWDLHGRSAGHRRNRKMVDEHLDAAYVIAFPLGESRGTRGCMAYAESKGLEVLDMPELGAIGHPAASDQS